MHDYKTIDTLRKEYANLDNYILSLTEIIAKLEANNIDLTNKVIKLEKEKVQFESCTARVYAPNKSYKELETKLAQAEELRKKDIDELWETRIIPLQNQVKDRDIQLESKYKQEIRQGEQIRSLKNTIENLGMLINYAVGYISSCEQFRDKYPNDVKNWLFEGLRNENSNINF